MPSPHEYKLQQHHAFCSYTVASKAGNVDGAAPYVFLPRNVLLIISFTRTGFSGHPELQSTLGKGPSLWVLPVRQHREGNELWVGNLQDLLESSSGQIISEETKSGVPSLSAPISFRKRILNGAVRALDDHCR